MSKRAMWRHRLAGKSDSDRLNAMRLVRQRYRQRAVRSHMCLPTRPLDVPTLLLEDLDHPIAVIALHFDHAVFDRAPGSACGLQIFPKLCECGVIQRKAADHGDALSIAAFGLSR